MMRTTWDLSGNKTKLTLLFSLTFLFLFSGFVYGQEEVKKEYWGNGKLKSKTPHNGLGSVWYESGEKEIEVHFQNGKLEGLEGSRVPCNKGRSYVERNCPAW